MTDPSLSETAGSGETSLLVKIFWRMALTMLIAMSCVAVLLLLTFRSHVDTLQDRSLNGQADDIARYLIRSIESGDDFHLPASLNTAYGTAESSYRFAIQNKAGQLIKASAGVSTPLYRGKIASDTNITYFQTIDSLNGREIYGASLRVIVGEQVFFVQVAQDATHRDVLADTFIDEFVDEVAWIAVLIFVALLGVTFISLKQALNPLQAISEQAAAIGPLTLDLRLPSKGIPTEICRLVGAVNSALDRLEQGFKNQRRFTADAAHEMRTPITLIRSHLDALQVKEAAELKSDLTGLERVVSQLLKLAQVDQFVVRSGQVADLHSVSLNVASFLAPSAIDAGKQIALTGATSVVVQGDSDALEVALRNLVENALEHTPKGTEVEINVSNPPVLKVSDRGGGIPTENKNVIFERFWRQDRHRGNGAGLGLSIVSRIVATHDARLEVDNHPDGGAVFSIIFPVTADPKSADKPFS